MAINADALKRTQEQQNDEEHFCDNSAHSKKKNSVFIVQWKLQTLEALRHEKAGCTLINSTY